MQQQGMAADVVMLGLAGFRVVEAAEVDGELELLIESEVLPTL